MPLGMLAKDSMVNLAELASKMEEESHKSQQQQPDDEVNSLLEGGSSSNDHADDGESKTQDDLVVVDDETSTGRNSGSSQQVVQLHVVVSSERIRGSGGGGGNNDDNNNNVDDGANSSNGKETQSQKPRPSGDQPIHASSSAATASGSASVGGSSVGSHESGPTNTTKVRLPASSTSSSEEKSNHRDEEDTVAKAEAAKAVGQYTGFSSDYHDFEHYVNHSYVYEEQPGASVPVNLGLTLRDGSKPWFCCLFPWMAVDRMELEDGKDDHQSSSTKLESMDHQTGIPSLSENDDTQGEVNGSPLQTRSVVRASAADEDEVSTVSTSSEMLGEKLSDKDRQAVLARLRLAPPDEKRRTDDRPSKEDRSQQTEPTPSASPLPTSDKRPRSILRRSSTVAASRESLNKMGSGGNRETSNSSSRRSLFPTYERKEKEKKDLHTSFSPMARVITIKSLKDMTEEERADIWWQKYNYEEFRKTGRMITKAMLEGGSEIWLATNQSWQTPDQGKAATLQNASTLADRHAAFKKGDRNAKIEYEDTRDKWWHKFGHSRRGLEHIASIDEGRQRQANVKASIKAVIDEQRRQKVFHREDPDKLRMVSVQNTSWARDLALASGASDADAVSKNFDDECRKSREFYLLKFSRANMLSKPTALKTGYETVVPAFMQPMVTMQIPASRLDAHTTSQIRYRQKNHQRTASGGSTLSPSSKPAPAAGASSTTHHRIMSAPSAVLGGDEGSGLERRPSMRIPIQDDSTSVGSDGQPKSGGKSMAKMAAGYADGIEEGDVSSILTGMGALPKKKAASPKSGTAMPKALYVSTVIMMMLCITGVAGVSSRFERHWSLYPRTYVATRVSGEYPLLDHLNGDLNKDVWRNVPFSEVFDDIRGDDVPDPDDRPTSSTRTRFKAVWDDTHLYIGAIMENHETDMPTQAHFTERNSPIFQKDSDFEIFVDINGSHAYYKEFEANAINTVWNLMLDKPYADGGQEHSGRVASNPTDPLYYEVHGQRSATKVVRGMLNDPTGHGATWSIEVALDFEDLRKYVKDVDMKDGVPIPHLGSMLRINFSRVEEKGDINWTWQPQRAWEPLKKKHAGFVDMHRPDCWGYFILGNDKGQTPTDVNGTMDSATPDVNDGRTHSFEEASRDQSWPGRLAAMNVYYAQHAFFDRNSGKSFASSLDELHDFIDDVIVSPFDIEIQTEEDSGVGTNGSTFVVHVAGNPDGSVVSVRQDRFLTVTPPPGSSSTS